MKRLILSLFVFMIFLIGCSKTEDLISPYHFSIIPKVSNFKLVAVDTTFTGKKRVVISWEISDTTNLKYFEIYRSQKNPDNYKIIVSNYQSYVFADSALPTIKDSLKLYYLVYPIGNKTDIRTGVKVSFIGPPSDTLVVTVKKLN
ncbi:MAG: hypothetical protein ACPL25_04405 [Ignavibacteria bacterium]